MPPRKSRATKDLEAEIARLTQENEDKCVELEEKDTELEENAATIQDHETKIGAFIADKKNLQARYQKNLAGIKRKRMGTAGAEIIKGLPFNGGVKVLVKKSTKRNFWRHGKFLANDKQQGQACDKIIMFIPDMVKQMKGKDEEFCRIFKSKFAVTYGGIVLHDINEHRSTVQSNLKTEYLLMIKNKNIVVTAQMMAQIIRRENMDYDPATPQDGKVMRGLYQWYWDVCLPKCAGCHDWGQLIRLAATISKARAPGTGDKKGPKRITTSTEAFVDLIWENSQPKWECERIMLAAGKKINKETKKEKDYVKAKYSDSSSGNTKYGGWSPAGRNRFIAIIAEIEVAKKEPHVKAVEEYCLRALRLQHGVDEKEGKRRVKKVKCDNTLQIEAAEVPFGTDDEDDGDTTDEEPNLPGEEEEDGAENEEEDEENGAEEPENQEETTENQEETTENQDAEESGNQEETTENQEEDEEEEGVEDDEE